MAPDWPKLTLKQAGVSLTDCDHRTPAKASSGFPYVTIPQLRDGRIALNEARRVSAEDFAEWTRKANPQLHDVVLSRRCNPGESAHVPAGAKFALGQNLVLLRSDGAHVYPPFLRWLVRGPEWWRQVETYINVGAVFTSLKCADIPKFELTIPPIDAQKRISNVLAVLDAKIDVNFRINQTLEAMVQAIFKSWFVDFDPVKAKIAAKAEGRDPLRAAMSAISGKTEAELDALPREQHAQLEASAALFPDALVSLPTGEAPEGWAMQAFAELTDKIGSGATPRGGKEVYQDEGVALIRSQNVYDSLFVWEGLARISDEAAAQLKGVTVQAGDVLLNITGASILRTCVVLPDVLPARVNQHVAIIRAKAGVPPQFLHQHLLLPQTKEFLLGLNAGASREAITKAHIESLAVLVPPQELLMAFRGVTDALFKQIECCSRQTRALAELRDTLLPKLLSGALSAGATHPTHVEVCP